MGNKIIVHPGMKFGMLIVIKECNQRIQPSGQSIRVFYCRCSCGNEKNFSLADLRSGHTISCGCYRKTFMVKHGKYNTKTYKVWSHMRERCLQRNTKSFQSYGGRGITICERWNTFENFYEDMGEKPEGKSLDRIDNNSGYCKENCRWATQKEQMNNTRNNVLVTYHGETKTLTQWADEKGIHARNLRHRLKKWKRIEDVFCVPVSRYNKHIYG